MWLYLHILQEWNMYRCCCGNTSPPPHTHLDSMSPRPRKSVIAAFNIRFISYAAAGPTLICPAPQWKACANFVRRVYNSCSTAGLSEVSKVSMLSDVREVSDMSEMSRVSVFFSAMSSVSTVSEVSAERGWQGVRGEWSERDERGFRSEQGEEEERGKRGANSPLQ